VLVGQFIDAFAHQIINVQRDPSNPRRMVVSKISNGAILGVRDSEKGTLVVSREALRTFVQKQHGSLRQLRTELAETGVLLSHDKRGNMTAGLAGMEGAPQFIWEIDLKHDSMLNCIQRLESEPHDTKVVSILQRRGAR
jgi:hypothetical protein